MSWTYDPAAVATTPTYQVRFLIQDTQPARPLCQDEEIAWTITQEATIWGAAALCCESLVARSAGLTNRKVGDLSLTYDPKFYRELGITLRAKAASDVVPFFGGQTISGKIANQQDSDAVVPAFAIGLDDNPGAPAPATLAPNPLLVVPQ